MRRRQRPWAKEMGLNETETNIVQRYIDHVQAKRLASVRRPFYEQVDREYPTLSHDAREELVDTLFGAQMARYVSRRADRQGQA